MEKEEVKQVLNRLDRVEGKLDKLTDVLVQVARTEERMNNLLKDFIDSKKAISLLEVEVKKLQKKDLEATIWLKVGKYGTIFGLFVATYVTASHKELVVEIFKIVLGVQ